MATRIWSRLDTSGDCWLWTGVRNERGYGTLTVANGTGHGDTRRVHRLVWELVNGPIPPGMLVCHRCDIRHCARPSHLFLGTPLDNMLDMVAKDRQPQRRLHRLLTTYKRSTVEALDEYANGPVKPPAIFIAQIVNERFVAANASKH